MENSTQLETLASEPAEPPSCSFLPYRRRRPLRSRTLDTLVKILSHLPSEGENGAVVRQTSEGVVTETRGVVDGDGKSNHDQMEPVDQLDGRPTHEGLGVDLVLETDVDNSKTSTCCQNGGFDVGVGQVTSPELCREDSVVDKTEEVAGENRIIVADLTEGNQIGDSAEMIKELEDANSVLGIQTDGFSSICQLETEKEFTVQDLCEVYNSSFGDDIDLQSSKLGESDLLLKEMELEKLISSPLVMGSNVDVMEDESVEEGEISGDAGIADPLLNELSEDAVSPGDNSTELVHGSDDNVNKLVLPCNDKERGHWRDDMPNHSIFNASASYSGSKKAELTEAFMHMQDSDSQNVLCDTDKMANTSSSSAPCLEKLSLSGRIPESDAENQTAAATIQDGVNKKKRKKGPLTEERKAKKKKKERIKRAEKNKKLGINRLKLPVSKPQTPKPCRHYLNGRCHEGVNCRFSHDIVPLTKSKPCSYFARQSCMKGDDCPFDHVLSKYPCDNYATKGFCSRGSDCLFSHTIPANQISNTTPSNAKPLLNSQQHGVPEKKESHVIPGVPQPCIKLTSHVNKSNSSKSADNHGTFHQGVDAKFYSGGTSSDRKAEKFTEPVRTAKHTPKGVSFLLSEGMPVGDRSKQKRDGSSSNGGGVTVSSSNTSNMSVAEAMKKPRGINFLSFTQNSSPDDTSSKTLSNLFSNVHNGRAKPCGIDFLANKPSHLPDSGICIEASKQQMYPNAADLVRRLNGGENIVPQTRVPEPVNKTSMFPGITQSYNPVSPKVSSSLRISPLSSTPGSVKKAVQSTLAFAAKFEPNIKFP